MGRVQLPPGLRAPAFTVAEARDAGLRDVDLRALHRPTRAVRALTPPQSLAERARAYAVALPADAAFSHVTAARLLGLPLPHVLPADAAFSHVTAARLLGLPLPHVLEADVLLDVMRPSGRSRTRRAGCRGHRGLESREVVLRHGLRVVAGPDTWCDLGELAGGSLTVDDLVVVADALLGPPHRLAVEALTTALDRRVRPRGRAALLDAIALARPGSRSPMETRARLMFVRAGFPEPEVNGVVRDAHGGWLLEGDLVWRRRRVIGEYQGEDHADRRRRSSDAHRAGLARDEGWTVLELWAEDIWSPPRRRTTLRRYAAELGIDPTTLVIA
jgi:hypothetical protein